MRDVIPPAPEDMILGLGMLDNQSCWLIGWIRWFWVTPTGSDIFDGSVGTKCSNHLHIHLSSSSIRRTATSTRSKNPWTGHQSITELNHWNTCPVPYQDGTKTCNLLTKMVSSQQRYKGERERERQRRSVQKLLHPPLVVVVVRLKLVRPGCSRSFITLETDLEPAMDKPSV